MPPIVSHELKSPLGAVQQNLFALVRELSGRLTEDQNRRVDRMKVRLADLLELINTWLRAISVDMDTIKEKFEPVSVTSAIAKAVESVQPHATRKDVDIVASIDEPLSLVFGHEGTITEALVNICTNAIKYSRMGRQVIIKAGQKDDHVIISVTDTGVGISEQDLPFVFDDFHSGKSGQTAERGYGLGLAMSRRIIETHNGSISVESELGRG